jgi:hypothetical protein
VSDLGTEERPVDEPKEPEKDSPNTTREEGRPNYGRPGRHAG